MPLEHAAGRAATSAVREQRGGQVVPGALGDDGVDPVVVGGGQQGDPAAVGGAGDPDPRIAPVVQQHPGLAGEPGDELLDVLDLVVGRVQPDLPGRGAEPRADQVRTANPARARSSACGRTASLVSPKPCASRTAGTRHAARRREETGVNDDVLVAARPVHDGDAHVADGQRGGLAQRDREDDARRHQRGGGHGRDDDLRSREADAHPCKDASNHRGMLRAARAAAPAPGAPRRQCDASLTCFGVVMMSY